MAVKKEMVRSGWLEVGGILLLACGALLFLSQVSYDPGDISTLQSPPNATPRNLIGPVGAWGAFIGFMTFGAAAYLLPALLLALSALTLFRREGRTWPKSLWMLALLVVLSALIELKPAWYGGVVERNNLASAGGLMGFLAGRRLFAGLLGDVGAVILLSGLAAAALVFLLDLRPARVGAYAAAAAGAVYRRVNTWLGQRRDRREQLEHEEREVAKQRRRLERAMQREPEKETDGAGVRIGPAPEPPPAPEPAPAPPPSATPAPEPKPTPRARRTAKAETPAAEREEPAPAAPPSYEMPPMRLLADLPPDSQREIQPGDLQKTGRILVETLSEFGIEAQVTNIETGPVVTRYELLPAPGVRVERIAGLSNNIALTMKAESVRVQAPIPGKGVVGIEVPNTKTKLVCLREVLESDLWREDKAALPLALGKDVGGRVIVADLAEMPHLLIAGATGSGKTVCMNSILSGLLMARPPAEMRLMLVDPKIVEFSAYNNLPHLVVPVITDPKKVALGLRWAITEMEKRYKMFARVGVRNIRSFNSRPIAKQGDLFGEEAAEDAAANAIPDRLPYIVIVVDELADLMLVAQADIENSIARLAQLSRAVGIHMILATQRPSVNVITGTIKANFPARIAFQVAQRVDSRTILDANGADKLLGKGDMLFLPPGSSKLIRAQGALTTDAEVHAIADHWRTQGEPLFEVAIKEKIEKSTPDLPDMEEDDELLQQAVEIIRQTHRASTSSLQRRLRIGYTRAARVMDLLEERGIVGPAQGSDPREILIDLDGEIPSNAPAAGAGGSGGA